MPTPQTVIKATLQEIQLGSGNTPTQLITDPPPLTVQFNPQTLKVNFSNQVSGGDQRGGASAQFVGQGTTKLTMELWFDVTVPIDAQGNVLTGDPNASAGNTGPDVRLITQKVAYFIKPKGQDPKDKKKFLPPAVRFQWGSFLFDGIMDSLNESLEYFSEQGLPLRASLQVSIVSQEIVVADTNYATQPGTQPQTPVSNGESVQQKAAQDGQPDNWKSIANANNIENPRQMDPGTLLDLNASAGVGGGLTAGISGSIGVSAGDNIGGGLSAGIGISGGIGVSAGAAVSIGGGISASAGGTATGGVGVSAGVSFSANVAVGGSASAGGGTSAVASSSSVSSAANTRFGASSSFGTVVVSSNASPFSNGLRAGFVGSVNASIIPN